MCSLWVIYVVVGKSELEKLELFDGKLCEFVCDNEDVVSYDFDQCIVCWEKWVMCDIFLVIVDVCLEDLVCFYWLQFDGDEWVVGCSCQVIVLVLCDKLCYGYCFCVDQVIGLFLCVQMLDGCGEVIEQIVFIQIDIGGIDCVWVNFIYKDMCGWCIEKVVLVLVDLLVW